MTRTKFHGTGVALVTPFKEDLSINYTALEKVVEFTIKGGVDYLVVQGTTGESVTVTEEEKKDILHLITSWNTGKALVFGIGGNDTLKILHSIEKFQYDKIDAILSVCPYYNKPSQAGLIKHFEMIAGKSPFPIILYNVPGRTSVNLNAESVIELSQHPNIVGIKEASGNFAQCVEIALHCHENFLLISGDDLFTIPLITLGGAGVISVLANALPDLMSNMVKEGLNGNFEKARNELFRISGINPLMYTEGNPAGVKYLMKLLGICDTYVRPPLVPVSESLQKKIREELQKIKK